MLKKILLGLFTVLVLLGAFFFWFISLLDGIPVSSEFKDTKPQQLPYLAAPPPAYRGKILAVVTSTAQMGLSGKSTGYELTELARAYYVFQANGFEVDIASPLGGNPPAVLDDDDMRAFDFAFLNDALAQQKLNNSLALAEVQPLAYEAVYFVGGKGTMWDFPDNPHIQNLVRTLYERQKVVGAVCHGPAALVNVTLSDGSSLVEQRQISSFTNSEELFLIPDAQQVFPFLLEDKLKARGAEFVAASDYLQQVSVDGQLVTGQNPWSVWQLAEDMVRQLGYTPVAREKTAEELSVQVLGTYEKLGYNKARAQLESMLQQGKKPGRELLAVHSFLAVMQRQLGKALDVLALLVAAQPTQEKADA